MNCKKLLSIGSLLLLLAGAQAQKYEIKFILPDDSYADSLFYIGQHYRDNLTPIDSARVVGNCVTFKGKKNWETGIYALYPKGQKKQMMDFTIDGSSRFTIRMDRPGHVADPRRDISGSPANSAMIAFQNHFNEARQRSRDIDKRLKTPDTKAAAEQERKALNKEMEQFEEESIKKNGKYRFFQLVEMFSGPKVPDEAPDKASYYLQHYWDGVALTDQSLVRTPDLFNKMNYYFFGLLYHADTDTIKKYADAVLHQIEDDTLMLRYFMDYIMPRYYRSTKNIGWDAVWCYLVRQYYLAGKCTWARESELYTKRKDVERLEQSLIGAVGQELWMADTNQSPNPDEWISSHQFPTRYVILWFWDPDCHHCQEQTATLKTLYDSLAATGNKPFEVYAVGYEADVDKWKRYVREHQLPFVNVGGNNVNIDYQVAYNVHGAPTMIILDEQRRIIMNKVLPSNAILPFLRDHEKRKQSKY